MIRVQLLAKRYAQALFDLALETKTVDQTARDMSLVKVVLEENRDLRKIMANPVMDAPIKLRLVNAIFGEKKSISELSLRFLQLIVRKRRESYLEGICEAFEAIFYDYKNLVRAEVITAYPINDEIRKEMIERLSAFTHKDIELKETTNEDIIGGFVLRVEDYQYDASIVNEMRKLRKTFGENLYVKQF